MKRLTLALTLCALPATGQADWVPMPGTECYCTDTQGSRVELGQRICLAVGGRMFMARCDMSQNVPIWRDTGQDCVTG